MSTITYSTFRLERTPDGIYWSDCMGKTFISPKKAIASYRNTPYASAVTPDKFRIVEEVHVVTEKVLDINQYILKS